jgi:uncharacterized membrane protein
VKMLDYIIHRVIVAEDKKPRCFSMWPLALVTALFPLLNFCACLVHILWPDQQLKSAEGCQPDAVIGFPQLLQSFFLIRILVIHEFSCSNMSFYPWLNVLYSISIFVHKVPFTDYNF